MTAPSPADDPTPEAASASSPAKATAERVKALVQQGWAALEHDEPQQAMHHFRQALRVRPGHPGARSGVVEALKARHPLYRWLLQRTFALGRMSPAVQIGIMVLAFVILRIVNMAVALRPDWAPMLWPFLIATFMLCVLIGVASPIFNMLLWLDPEGRQSLTADETSGAKLLLVSLLWPLPVLIWALVAGNGLGIVVWVLLTMIALPASAIYRCGSGWPRWTMIGVTIALLALNLPLLASLFGELTWLNTTRQSHLIAACVYSLLGAQVVATILQTLRRA